QEAWPEPAPWPGNLQVPAESSLAHIPGPEVGPVDPRDVVRPVVESLAGRLYVTSVVDEEVSEGTWQEVRDALELPLAPFRNAAAAAVGRVGSGITKAIPHYVSGIDAVKLDVSTPQSEAVLSTFVQDLSLAISTETRANESLELLGAGARRAAAVASLEVF